MKIAIVGSGVSGLVAASLLHERHEVTVFEKDDRIGGHVNTIDVSDAVGGTTRVDTGFIVYNEHNYPLFSKLLTRLGVRTQSSNMSFSVRSDAANLEYSSATLRTLFAQRRNLVDPRFYAMLRDILRFNRESGSAVRNGAADLSLGEYTSAAGYGAWLSENYLVPMASALWSVPRAQVLDMPAEFFVRFFESHGMLTTDDPFEWRVVSGGSARYVEALTRPFRDRIRTRAPVQRVTRSAENVCVNGESYDRVVFACHSDQTLRVLEDATPLERELLGSIGFQRNEVVLHSDVSVLPTRTRAWASWNYHIGPDAGAPATVTYNMNRLQTLEATKTYCVTLNPTAPIAPESVLYRTEYSHPVHTRSARVAQARWSEIDGCNRTHFCGAYWGFGFHEDGVRSAVAVTQKLGVDL